MSGLNICSLPFIIQDVYVSLSLSISLSLSLIFIFGLIELQYLIYNTLVFKKYQYKYWNQVLFNFGLFIISTVFYKSLMMGNISSRYEDFVLEKKYVMYVMY